MNLIKCDWCNEIIKEKYLHRIIIDKVENKDYFERQIGERQTYDLCDSCFKLAKLPNKYKVNFVKKEKKE